MTKTHQRKQVNRAAHDDLLLVHAMYLMAIVDGEVTEEEMHRFLGFLDTMPLFKDANIDELVSESRKLVARHGGPLESLEALIAVEDPVMRARCFLLATEVAYASGDINAAEAQLLDSMAKLLRLDAAETTKILDVMALRYAVVV